LSRSFSPLFSSLTIKNNIKEIKDGNEIMKTYQRTISFFNRISGQNREKNESKGKVKYNFFENVFMNISTERLEIPFHFCKNITLKCQHLHNFPLLSTSLLPNSSTEDLQIKKVYITENTGYIDHCYIYTYIHTHSEHF